MHKSIQSNIELELFNHLLLQSWVEKGYEIETAQGDTDCFLFSLDDKNWCGTLELKPFELSTYAELFEVDNQTIRSLSIQKIMEIDKLSISKEQRNSGVLEEILYVITKHAYLHHYSHAVALIEPTFFRAIRFFYKMPARQFGSKFMYKGDHVIPMIIDMNEATTKYEELGWHKESLYDIVAKDRV